MDNGERWAQADEPPNHDLPQAGAWALPLPGSPGPYDELSGLDLLTPGNAARRFRGAEEFYKQIENRAWRLKLTSPNYVSFHELQKLMTIVQMHEVPSGAVKIMFKEEEETGPLVPPDAEVTLHYAAYLEHMKVPFDTSLTANNGRPIRVRLGIGTFLPGLEIALTYMKGQTSRFVALLEPEVMWSNFGKRRETTLFVIVVCSVQDRDPYMFRYNELAFQGPSRFDAIIRRVQAIRSRSKDLFAQKRLRESVMGFHYAIKVLSSAYVENIQQDKEVMLYKVKIYHNLATCYYRLCQPKQVLKMCEYIDLFVDIETIPKALFYRGRGYQMLGETDLAIEYYMKANDLKPENVEIAEAILKLNMEANREEREPENLVVPLAFDPLLPTPYRVEESFENEARVICAEVASKPPGEMFYLPDGMCDDDEVLCIKLIASRYNKLFVSDVGDGWQRQVAVIKMH